MSSSRTGPSVACWRLPRLLAPIFREIYHLHFVLAAVLRWLYRAFYAIPLFRGRCDSVGSGLQMMKMPIIGGHGHLILGNNVRLRGHFGISSGSVISDPQLVVGDRVDIGAGTILTLNQEIRMDSGVTVGETCRFMDTNGHPRDALLRAANVAPAPEEIKPIHVCANASIGRGSFVLRGVTIGENATILPNSVVIANVPANSVVAGNPVRILSRGAPPKQPVEHD